jgi:GGDEF domain-containing protein
MSSSSCVEDLDDDAEAWSIAHRILQAIRQPLTLTGTAHTVSLTASGGAQVSRATHRYR